MSLVIWDAIALIMTIENGLLPWLYIYDTMIEKQTLNFRCGDSCTYFAGITLGMGSSNERRRYNVIFSVID